MDVDILSKLIKDIVLVQDRVSLPGLGAFYTEIIPSTFSDKGYTIHPPYRRLSFSPRASEDSLLARHWAEESSKPQADAEEELTTFLSQMKEVLKQRKTIILPGLGRLRATRENHFFFVADEDLDIFPAGFGLQSISLKNHQDFPEEPMDIPEPPVTTTEPPEETKEEPVSAQETPAQSKEETQAEAPEQHAPIKRKRRFPVVIIVLAAIALLLFAALAILGRVAPDFIDTLLYTPEEIENIKLLNL